MTQLEHAISATPDAAAAHADSAPRFGRRRWVVLGVLMMMATVVSSQFGNFMATYAIKALKLPPVKSNNTIQFSSRLKFVPARRAGCTTGSRIPMTISQVPFLRQDLFRSGQSRSRTMRNAHD